MSAETRNEMMLQELKHFLFYLFIIYLRLRTFKWLFKTLEEMKDLRFEGKGLWKSVLEYF